MTRAEALAKARKLWGKRAFLRVGPRLSSPEDREQRLSQVRDLRASKITLDAHYAAWLEQQPEHQRYLAARRIILDQIRTHDVMPYYKFELGVNLGWATEIKGWGDTWEDAFTKGQSSVWP